MAARVFLHIGTMKTATTYLQALCKANQASLLGCGVLWPGRVRNFTAIEDLFGEGTQGRGAWTRLRSEIEAFDGSVLISNELLARRDAREAELLIDSLAPATVSVIITARDLARIIPSAWQTRIRNRATMTWPDFAEAIFDDDRAASDAAATFWRQHDLPDIVTRWSTKVPLDRITVVTVPPPGSSASVIGDRFLSVVLDKPLRLDQPVVQNTSLGADSAELIRRINVATAGWGAHGHRPVPGRAVAHALLADHAGDEPPIQLSSAQRARASALAEETLRRLEPLGLSVAGDLTELLPSTTPLPREPQSQQWTEAGVAAAAVHVLTHMTKKDVDATGGRRARKVLTRSSRPRVGDGTRSRRRGVS